MLVQDLRRVILEVDSHVDVFRRSQRVEQVMRLEDEADVPADRHQLLLAQTPQLLSQDLNAAFLDGAQGPDQGQQRRLTAARGAGQDDQLARADLEVQVEEHLLADLPLAVGVVQAADMHRRLAIRCRGRPTTSRPPQPAARSSPVI